MTTKLAPVLLVSVCLCYAASAMARQVPQLSKDQRTLLQAVVAAADAATTQSTASDLSWPTHVMRASDGSHYVAFWLEPPDHLRLPSGPVMLYVRLATSPGDGPSRIVERSAVREWLAGSRTDPRLLPKRNIAIGDMPAFGAGSIAARGSTASPGSTDLRLMEHERQRQKDEQNERDKRRRNELEGRQQAAHDLLPFEDFDLASKSARPDGTRILSRAFTAGPGDYDLIVAWADASAPKATTNVHVLRKPLRLLPARTAGLAASAIILADHIGFRQAPYSPSEQASHPYSIGVMEITPALGSRYRRDQDLSVAFQVINPQANDAGMPDVAVTFRVVRVGSAGETAVASFNPQYYNATTLPSDFNLRLGHPVFAAVTAPLATLPRGDYRLKVVLTDRLAGRSANTEADFSVVGTPRSLLGEAPSLGGTFKRDALLEPATLTAIVQQLTPPSPSPALERALAIATSGKFVDLLVEEPVAATENGIRTALTGLAFLLIGDSSAVTHFQRALQQNAPAAPLQFLIGAARAAQSRDLDAIAAWQSAITTGTAPDLTRPMLAEAYLRRSDPQRAADTLGSARPATPTSWTRALAATYIANHREADAIALLDVHLAARAEDQDARWLLLHALYSQFVLGGKPLPAVDTDRFIAHAQAYVDAKGVNHVLAAEWLKVISSS